MINHALTITPHLTIAGNHCTVHGDHRPEPVRTVKHHIHPQEYGGKTITSNLVWVCDTGHYNIHAGLDALLAGKPMPRMARAEKALAQQGYKSILDSPPQGLIGFSHDRHTESPGN